MVAERALDLHVHHLCADLNEWVTEPLLSPPHLYNAIYQALAIYCYCLGLLAVQILGKASVLPGGDHVCDLSERA